MRFHIVLKSSGYGCGFNILGHGTNIVTYEDLERSVEKLLKEAVTSLKMNNTKEKT